MTTQEFEQLRHDAVHELMDLNEQCENAFRLGEWPRWSYDLDTATLTFSRDGIPRVIAGIQLVGSTSPDEATWTWGWADLDVPAKSTELIEKVRAYGERDPIPNLLEPTLPADQYLGWEMTAIAARVLDAKGAYRCQRPGGGTLYFIYREIAFAPDLAAATVECGQHGRGFPAYVCEHLSANPVQPWFSEESSPGNPWPDAWCASCDTIFLQEGEWNERTSTRIRVKLVCHHCYETMRKLAG